MSLERAARVFERSDADVHGHGRHRERRFVERDRARLLRGRASPARWCRQRPATRAGGAYSVDAMPLAPGTYTARAEQSDAAGNVGYSAATTFVISGAGRDRAGHLADCAAASSTDTTPTFAGTGGTLAGDSTSRDCARLLRADRGRRAGAVAHARARGTGAYSVDPRPAARYLHRARRAERRRRQRRLQPGGTFTITGAADTTAPAVTIGHPVAVYNDTAVSAASPAARPATSSPITVRVYPGSSISGSPMMSITTPRMSGNWYIVQSPSLAAGTYTARAEQSDSAGNTGYSAPRTFTITPDGGGGRPRRDGAGDLAGGAAVGRRVTRRRRSPAWPAPRAVTRRA